MAVSVLAVSVLASSACAQEAKESPKSADSEDKASTQTKFDEVNREYSAAYAEKLKEYRETSEVAEKNKLRVEILAMGGKYAAKFLEVAEENPKSDLGFKALTWMMQRARSAPETKKAQAIMFRDYADFPGVATFCSSLSRRDAEFAEKKKF